MAGPGGLASEPAVSAEVFPWLKSLPVAPEYHPTLAEFQDPIAYIFKIEKEASKFGICKIVPPVLQSPKKTVISNFNRSLVGSPPTFTTRQQQIGFCPRRSRPVQKSVWQSGESYTFHEFEAKAKQFEKGYMKKHSSKKGVEKASSLSPLEIETLYWKATLDKPFSVEYANDMPGSAFSQMKEGGGGGGGNVVEGVTVGDTEWNMRGVSRAKGSLLRFMKEDIPGVTSPMVYVAMMFSWFAWHVEDHDLHSLNYLHTGAGKTWYGVPRDAAVAFEEVVRVHGYGGEINPLVTFSVLGEKTTVMSPEVIINAGIPCCRLVQNPGEFVVTFPRAYHSGFSHGFNCGEAANIATPEWLRVAKDAAVRRASINYPPMVSHFQLLYDLALELCTRIPMSIGSKPRSSRLRDKQKGEGEALVKEFFVKNIARNDHLLHILGKDSSIVLLPQSSLRVTSYSNLRVGSQLRANRSFGLCGHKGLMRFSRSLVTDDLMLDRNHGLDQRKGYHSSNGNFATLCEKNMVVSSNREESASELVDVLNGDKLPSQRLFSCVKCGILCFDCVAVVQPREAAATHLMSADCSFLNDWIAGSQVTRDRFAVAGGDAATDEPIFCARWPGKRSVNSSYDVPVQSVKYQTQMAAQSSEMTSETGRDGRTSALGLLAITYGNSSDSEEDHSEADVSSHVDEIGMTSCLSRETHLNHDSALASLKRECCEGLTASNTQCSSMVSSGDIALHQTNESPLVKDSSDRSPDFFTEPETNNLASNGTIFGRTIIPAESSAMSFQRSDEDSSRMHVFCLEHAMEVEQQLHSIGGVHFLLFCHPEYPRIVAEAKTLAEELGTDHHWNNLSFREATAEDGEKIQLVLDSEDAIPGNADWAVKLGINLFYSANLSWSPLYSKQMPYNTVIYDAFGRSSPSSSPSKSDVSGRRSGRQKKVVAGKWCGKVWMSNQVHPFLAKWDSEERDSEQEQERSFRSGTTPETKPRGDHKTEADIVTRKYQRKRKMMAEGRSVKKAKTLEAQCLASCHSAEDYSYKQYSRTRNSKQTKLVERRILYKLLEDNYLKQSRRIPENKRFKSIGREDSVSDDSLEVKTYEQFRRILSGNAANYIDGGNMLALDALERNRHSKFPRSKQVKFVDKEVAVSDDSLEDNNVCVHGRARRRREFFAGEVTFSDDSSEESPSQLRGRLLRIKQARNVDDTVSDDSVEDGCYQRISGGKETVHIDSEEADSDDSLEQYSHKLRTIFPRKKQAKSPDGEDECSDDSLGDDAYQPQRTKRSKHSKFLEMEETTSEDSTNEFIHQQLIRDCKSKKAKNVENDVSDHLPGYTTHRHRQISRTTKAKSIKNEDELSDHLPDDHTCTQGRKTPRNTKLTSFTAEDSLDDMPLTMHCKLWNSLRGKLARCTRREEEASDDSLEDDSNQPSCKVVSSKQNKLTTLPKVKQTSRQAKKGTAKLIKTPQGKSERQVKQESSRLRSRKSEQSATQFDPHTEDELEGGPSTRLRRRPSRVPNQLETVRKGKQKISRKEAKTSSDLKASVGQKNRTIKDEDAGYQCDMEGCTMSFGSKQELALHKRNICPVKGCGKKFFSHKYLVQHRRVHLDDRPLKCPWKGCKMTFKWAWARTEHIRVHTGARPYVCAEEGCGQTFRFVSDFSRHKRRTGHSAKKIVSNSRKSVT